MLQLTSRKKKNRQINRLHLLFRFKFCWFHRKFHFSMAERTAFHFIRNRYKQTHTHTKRERDIVHMSHNEDNALTNSSVSESFWGFMRFVFVTRISNNNKASVRLILTSIEINVSFLHLASSPFSSVSFHSKTRCVCVCAFFWFFIHSTIGF